MNLASYDKIPPLVKIQSLHLKKSLLFLVSNISDFSLLDESNQKFGMHGPSCAVVPESNLEIFFLG